MSAHPVAARTVVIGVGNPFRRDDGAGAAVVEAVAAGGVPATVHVVALDGEPTRLLDAWEGAELVVVIDAARSGAPPGTVTRLEIGDGEEPLAPSGGASSHGAGVAEAVALGRALQRLPARLVVYGIEGADFGTGPGLSSPVEHAVAEVVRLLEQDLPPG